MHQESCNLSKDIYVRIHQEEHRSRRSHQHAGGPDGGHELRSIILDAGDPVRTTRRTTHNTLSRTSTSSAWPGAWPLSAGMSLRRSSSSASPGIASAHLVSSRLPEPGSGTFDPASGSRLASVDHDPIALAQLRLHRVVVHIEDAQVRVLAAGVVVMRYPEGLADLVVVISRVGDRFDGFNEPSFPLRPVFGVVRHVVMFLSMNPGDPFRSVMFPGRPLPPRPRTRGERDGFSRYQWREPRSATPWDRSSRSFSLRSPSRLMVRRSPRRKRPPTRYVPPPSETERPV